MKVIKILIGLLSLIYMQLAIAQAPQTLSYQGVLTDAQGNSVPDGAVDLTCRLYEAASGGNPLWEETQQVTVTDGVFSTILGSTTVLNLPFDKPYWLGLAINGDSELEPRTTLTAAAYSLFAESIADSSVSGKKIKDAQVVRSINGLKDAVTLTAGDNITIAKQGQQLMVSAAGSTGPKGDKGDKGDPGVPGTSLWTDNGNKVTTVARVGIGTSNPSTRLHVKENGGTAVEAIGEGSFSIGLEARGDFAALVAKATSSNGVAVIATSGGIAGQFTGGENNGSQAPVVILSGNQAMLLDGNEIDAISGALYLNHNSEKNIIIADKGGNVGIGTASPNFKLHVNGSAGKPGGGSWSSASDRRLKDVKGRFSRGLAALDQLNPVYYNYRAGNPADLPSEQEYVGLIAQDVAQVIPEAVGIYKDDYLSVNNDPIIWTMLNAIKELKAEIEALKAKTQ